MALDRDWWQREWLDFTGEMSWVESSQSENERDEGRLRLARVREVLISRGVRPESVRSSLSHSKGVVLAVGCASTRYLKVGVDLERSDRVVGDAVADRVIQPDERRFGLRPLEYWVLKEAAYKAHPRPDGTVVSQYVLKNWNPETRTGEIRNSKDATVLHVKLAERDGWTVAFAALPQ